MLTFNLIIPKIILFINICSFTSRPFTVAPRVEALDDGAGVDASVVVLLDVLPDAALVQLFADIDIDIRRNRDLDDVAVGHRDLDGCRSVPEAVPGLLKPFFVNELLEKVENFYLDVRLRTNKHGTFQPFKQGHFSKRRYGKILVTLRYSSS